MRTHPKGMTIFCLTLWNVYFLQNHYQSSGIHKSIHGEDQIEAGNLEYKFIETSYVMYID